jgi:hypothetical protein
MKGSVGTPTMMDGQRSRVLRPSMVSHIIWARDILKCKVKVDKMAASVCRLAVKYPTAISFRQQRVIRAVWVKLATGGHLRGIRTRKSA